MDANAEMMKSIRKSLASLNPAPRVEPNDPVDPGQVFMPESHRAVLDMGRQLVVGNRGMGKSLWTHALSDTAVRERVAKFYSQPALKNSEVLIGFNGSDKASNVAPTPDSISRALGDRFSGDEVWKAVFYRAMRRLVEEPEGIHIEETLLRLKQSPLLYDEALAAGDDFLQKSGRTLLVLFDALDRLASDWTTIRTLTTSLLRRTLGLKSFRSFRAKIFIRPDQFSDPNLFQFPDGSKLKNEYVDLSWRPHELFGLLFFELSRNAESGKPLDAIAERVGSQAAIRFDGNFGRSALEDQANLVSAIAGKYMGSDARRGRVYTWVPLHLSDAQQTCSPRTFLTAWQKAAEHQPAPEGRAVDHLGLIEGVRSASSARLEELREDYRWIDIALDSLRGQFVPIARSDLFDAWRQSGVMATIRREAKKKAWLIPEELQDKVPGAEEALLAAMKNIAVMEERANGKINVPDIFRVHAGIKRKGGVAVPRKA